MDIKLNRLKEAALLQAKQLADRGADLSCEVCQDTALSKAITVPKTLLAIFLSILSVGLLLIGIPLAKTLASALESVLLPFPQVFLGIVYYGCVLLMLGRNVYALCRGFRNRSAKRKKKKIGTLAAMISGEQSQLDGFDEQVKAAVKDGRDMIIKPRGYWQTELNQYEQDYLDKLKNDGKKYQKLCTVVVAVVLLAGAIALYPFITGGLSGVYGKGSGLTAAGSYIVLLVVLMECMFRMQRWYAKWMKLGAALGFALYQILIAIKLLLDGVLLPDAAVLESGEVLKIIGAFLFNYPLLSLLLMTAVALVLILAPQYTVVDNLRRQGVSVMNTNAQTEQVSAQKAEGMLLRKAAICFFIALFAGSMVGGVISGGWSFWNAVKYVIATVLLMACMFALEGSNRFYAVYSKLSVYLWYLFYAGYVIVVLSLVPDFGWGTLVLMAINWCSRLGGIVQSTETQQAGGPTDSDIDSYINNSGV